MATETISTQVLTFKFRVLPSKQQHAALAHVCEQQRQLYNAALQERLDYYAKTGKGRTYIDQCKALTEWRQVDADAATCPANIQRWTLKRLDDAYNAFFRRLKARNGKAGFPRFRGKGRWDSFGFAEFSGIRFDGKRLRFRGLPGGLRVHLHRPLPQDADIRSCVFRREGKGWHVCFQMRVECAERREPTRCIGIDVGLVHLATLSNGEHIPNPRHVRRAERELRRRQRALSRCKRGSNRRKKVRARVAR
ncbi:MAG: transposase, partial [Dehalococcoidia bacterium]